MLITAIGNMFGTDRTYDYWDITQDEQGYIYMDPKGAHENTIIMLHGYQENSTMFYNNFTESLMAPASTRIILPQAPLRWNSIWGGSYSRSWWELIKAITTMD